MAASAAGAAGSSATESSTPVYTVTAPRYGQLEK
eukprot:CAMPEP_0194540104 /NCGR_PEP_ID=MMETSP0253-20130528/80262_1 /TAXON_ID=2966 /ORGANISM="Noctiluca scintillans" /LENGTH=33 /DNA_ID= /DNA_START= /DNA_END= /DNA_ORIENTATION=